MQGNWEYGGASRFGGLVGSAGESGVGGDNGGIKGTDGIHGGIGVGLVGSVGELEEQAGFTRWIGEREWGCRWHPQWGLGEQEWSIRD